MAGNLDIPKIATPLVNSIVYSVYQNWSSKAEQAFDQAQSLIGSVQNFQVPFAPGAVDFNGGEGTLSSFQIPNLPDIPNLSPDLAYTSPGAAPNAPAVNTNYNIAAVAPGGFNGVEPTLNLPNKPGPLAAQVPGDAPTVSDVTLPATPSIDLPADPVLQGIVIPEVPELTLPTFEVEIPTIEFEPPSGDFNFSEPGYDSVLLDKVTAAICDLVAGGGGVDPAIERQIYDRDRTRIHETSFKARQEAMEDWSSRGFTLPGGEIEGKLCDLRRTELVESNKLSRDVAIKSHDVAIENFRFAIQQGIALETQLMGLYNNIYQRALEVERLTAEIAINFFNAQVNQFNAQVALVEVQATVFKARVEAELAKVQIFREQVEAQKAIADVDEALVRAYAEKVKATLAVVDIYRAQLEGVKTQVDVDRARIDAFKSTVDVYTAQVDAKRSEYVGYGEEVRAEGFKFEAFKASVDAYVGRIQGYAAQVDGESTAEKLKFDAERLKLQGFQAKLEGFVQQVQAEATRIQAEASALGATGQIASAYASVEQSRVSSDAAQINLGIEKGRSDTQFQIENNRVNIAHLENSTQQALEAMRTVSSVSAQLAAGAMSAINVAATMNDSFSWTQSLGESVSHSLTGDSLFGVS